ncbi:MAG: insulinase family protein [Myxococcaceae bacterium]|nr:insulinase family protein [Myxococcaceae bacterium]
MSARGRKKETTLAVQLPPFEEFDTSGGMRVVLARREPIPLVSVRLVVRAGSAVDPAGRHGLANFTARLLRRGTRSMSADAINDAVEFVGASLGAGATEDYSAVSMTLPARHLDAMLEVMGQLVREPSFPESEVETARRRVLAQLANDLDDPGLVADRALTRVLWGDHPYGHDVNGSHRDVSRFTRDEVIAFYRAHYGPKIALLVVVGAVDPSVARRAVERAFGDWRGGPSAPVELPGLHRAAGAGRVLLLDKPDQTQSQVRIGSMGLRRGAPGWIPATIMNTTLGGGFTSRLVNEIRVNRGLSYGAGSGFDGMLAGGSFSVSTFTKTESTGEIIEVALGEIARMKAKGPTARELETAKTYVAGLYPLRLETNESVAAAIAETRVYGLGDDWVTRYRERVRAVTLKDAREAAARLLPGNDPALVVVGNAAKVKKQVKRFGVVDVRSLAELE